jgi:hypothetical protein
MSETDLAELVEFFLWGALSLLPPGMGGGELTPNEQKMLGRVWSLPLLPLVQQYSKEAPWVAAVAVTAEVLLKRATLYKLSQRAAGNGSGEGDE